MNRTKYNAHFKAVLSQLNHSQLQAVEQIEGPVMVIAGPGTGKTHILTARIGQILLNTDTQAHNILCLTFTDAAVNAMRQRLLDFIGPEAHRVHIYTFHSFCNKVIQEHLEVFGRHDLDPLSDLERIDIVRGIIDNLDIEHTLKSSAYDIYYYEQHLADLFKLMKAERWSIDFIQNKITEYLADLPNQPEMRYKRNAGEYKIGDLKAAEIQKITRQMKRLYEGAKLFDAYQQELLKRQRYDYEDMILWVLEAFEKEEFLLRLYQEQYLYFLVDEFQDTNGSQSAVVEHLVSYWGDNPNLFIVGDDDQSIYEFQGARVKNMVDFYDKYHAKLLLIVLRENYRSTQAILDAARATIDHNEIRIIKKIKGLELDKILYSANPLYSSNPTPVQIRAYPNETQEEIFVIQEIEALQKQGIALKEIAIIYAKHRQGDHLIKLLEKRNIPYQTKRRINVLELPLMHNLRKLLGYIAQEATKPLSNEEVFFEFLYYDFIGISPSDAHQLVTWLSTNNHQLFKEKEYDNLHTWRGMIRQKEILESLHLQDIQRIIQFSEFLDSAIYNSKNWSLPQLFEYIINKSGLVQFIAHHEQKLWFTQVLLTFFDFIKQETAKNHRLTLKGMLYLLEQMESNNIGMGVFQLHYAEDGVNLLTAHSAKGLEFEYVFIINALKDFWEPNNSAGRRFPFPDNISYSSETDGLEAARRLFYVAMTRAKKQLYISYYQYDKKQKGLQNACFIAELQEATDAVQFSEQELKLSEEWQLLLLQQAINAPIMPLLDKATLDYLLEDFKMSISAMNSYIHCPLGFYFEYVLKIPTLQSVEASYGIAIHNTLHKILNFAIFKNKNVLPDILFVLDTFVVEMKKQRYHISQQAYKECLELGNRHLPMYYASRKASWSKTLQEATILTEKSLKNVEWQGIPMTGVVDKLLFLPSEYGLKLHVVDYKTGKLKEQRLQSPTEANPYGGTYWRQLIFYKILIDNSNIATNKVSSAEIDYLTPNEDNIFPSKTIYIENQEVLTVERIIKEVYTSILKHDFAEGCGKPTCKWCSFAKRNLTPDSFADEEIELLDD